MIRCSYLTPSTKLDASNMTPGDFDAEVDRLTCRSEAKWIVTSALPWIESCACNLHVHLTCACNLHVHLMLKENCNNTVRPIGMKPERRLTESTEHKSNTEKAASWAQTLATRFTNKELRVETFTHTREVARANFDGPKYPTGRSTVTFEYVDLDLWKAHEREEGEVLKKCPQCGQDPNSNYKMCTHSAFYTPTVPRAPNGKSSRRAPSPQWDKRIFEQKNTQYQAIGRPPYANEPLQPGHVISIGTTAYMVQAVQWNQDKDLNLNNDIHIKEIPWPVRTPDFMDTSATSNKLRRGDGLIVAGFHYSIKRLEAA